MILNSGPAVRKGGRRDYCLRLIASIARNCCEINDHLSYSTPYVRTRSGEPNQIRFVKLAPQKADNAGPYPRPTAFG
ncbi:Protein of unknown function [Pyronema omphalodes CBS 100304]|uniref:Uncharacterized protein n=1 Tax=Pyronema omphalodes (strain CBS 100304) TaxID=1076935 RepID=U4LUL4_PYROM|nr:Protein of unknown function [Pyronema omphalodes CBS 100304]